MRRREHKTHVDARVAALALRGRAEALEAQQAASREFERAARAANRRPRQGKDIPFPRGFE